MEFYDRLYLATGAKPHWNFGLVAQRLLARMAMGDRFPEEMVTWALYILSTKGEEVR